MTSPENKLLMMNVSGCIFKREMIFCGCGKESVVRTSWTSRNPGRRFYSCLDRGSNCSFITWVDPEMCPRSILIIPGLLKSKNEAERKCRAVTDERNSLRKYLFISWVFFL
ncbi:hypothetical protein R6Q57_015853 [Mikania cordata]